MATGKALREITILGAHPVNVTEAEFAAAVADSWGTALSPAASAEAQQAMREHFDQLRLIEVRIDPPDADVDWGAFTQMIEGQPRGNWQAVYDETPVERNAGCWAFFMHAVDEAKPLLTPLGERALPAASPTPARLSSKRYVMP